MASRFFGYNTIMKKKRILIIEDDTIFTMLVAALLQREGYEVFTAVDGVDGLRIATTEHPDLILLDIVMPVMNGYETLQKIKERKIPTRVVMMSVIHSP